MLRNTKNLEGVTLNWPDNEHISISLRGCVGLDLFIRGLGPVPHGMEALAWRPWPGGPGLGTVAGRPWPVGSDLQVLTWRLPWRLGLEAVAWRPLPGCLGLKALS